VRQACGARDQVALANEKNLQNPEHGRKLLLVMTGFAVQNSAET